MNHKTVLMTTSDPKKQTFFIFVPINFPLINIMSPKLDLGSASFKSVRSTL